MEFIKRLYEFLLLSSSHGVLYTKEKNEIAEKCMTYFKIQSQVMEFSK